MTSFSPNWSANLSALNVKDFGAVGDGVTDDTDAIQATFAAAWGDGFAGTAHAILNPNLNSPVFFPSGGYKVVAKNPLTVTNVSENGLASGALMRITVAEDLTQTVTHYKTGWYVYPDSILGTQIGAGGAALGSDVFAGRVNTPHGITIIDAHNFDLTMPPGKPADVSFTGTISSGTSLTVTAGGNSSNIFPGVFVLGGGGTVPCEILSGTYPGPFVLSTAQTNASGVSLTATRSGFWNSKTDGVHYDDGSYDTGTAVFVGSTDGAFALTVSSVTSGTVRIGMTVNGGGLLPGTTIVSGTFPNFTIDNPGPASGTMTGTNGRVSTAALHIRNVNGTMISGAGRSTTAVFCQNGSCISLNGVGFTKVQDMGFSCPLPVQCPWAMCAFELTWDQTAQFGESPTNGFQSTQSNTFQNCGFSGGYRTFLHGWGGAMTSETSFYNNFFGNSGTKNISGIYIGNQNSLGISIIGGNFQGCGTGIHVGTGSIETIHGVHFQGSQEVDIGIFSSQGDATEISGCRSESSCFLEAHDGIGLHVTGCSHLQTGGRPSDGLVQFAFYESGGLTPAVECNCATIQNCFSAAGNIAGNGLIALQGSNFGVGIKSAVTGVFSAGRITSCDVGPIPFAQLPAANTRVQGLRMIVNDSTQPIWSGTVSNAGQTIRTAGTGGFASDGGANVVPVYCDAVEWRLG